MSHISKDQNSSNPVNNEWNLGVDLQREQLVVGPNGNHILVDSPILSELPPYSSTENITPLPRASREQDVESTERIQKPRRTIGNYNLVSTLGSGSMGKVRLALHNTTNDKVDQYD
ncbi:hypothetical protein G6F56_005853 [Rhizopus delemar]|nr:hypothetical protein G6F56_005853 [Rhizopus delemar]